MGELGLDFSFAKIKASDIKAKRYGFVIRYLSHDPSKNITVTEFRDDVNNALSVCLVFEDRADRAKDGRSGGAADSQIALTEANMLGWPDNRPIYFAVDYDAPESDQPAINEYFTGVRALLGPGRVGCYGSFYVLKRLFDAGLIDFGYQTLAWSGGQIEPRAHIYQNGKQDFGNSADVNEALKADFGQYPFNPVGGGDLPVNDQQIFEDRYAALFGGTNVGVGKPSFQEEVSAWQASGKSPAQYLDDITFFSDRNGNPYFAAFAARTGTIDKYDVPRQIGDAVTNATAPLNEQIKKLQDQINNAPTSTAPQPLAMPSAANIGWVTSELKMAVALFLPGLGVLGLSFTQSQVDDFVRIGGELVGAAMMIWSVGQIIWSRTKVKVSAFQATMPRN